MLNGKKAGNKNTHKAYCKSVKVKWYTYTLRYTGTNIVWKKPLLYESYSFSVTFYFSNFAHLILSYILICTFILFLIGL